MLAVVLIGMLQFRLPVSADEQLSPPPDSGLPPTAHFSHPLESLAIAGEIVLRLEASDTAGIVAPVRFYIAPSDTPPDHLGHLIGEGRGHGRRHGERRGGGGRDGGETETISAPGETIVIEQVFDTSEVPDRAYRIRAVVTNIYSHSTRATLHTTIDNRVPRVRIHRPRGTGHGQIGPGLHRQEDDSENPEEPESQDMERSDGKWRTPAVTDAVDVIASATDRNLGSWSLVAKIGDTTIATLGSGTGPLRRQLAGRYVASMAPPGYVGPVDLVLSASDTATPEPNIGSDSVTIFSDYYLDAYGSLLLAPSYEVSTTIPVMASVTGEL
ncbi:MAG: hypothetical protein DCC49_08910, partial [Acidobacteria bacterium]